VPTGYLGPRPQCTTSTLPNLIYIDDQVPHPRQSTPGVTIVGSIEHFSRNGNMVTLTKDPVVIRPTREVCNDILQELHKLRVELSGALGEEGRRMAERVEKQARKLLRMKALGRGGTDEDGDVEMEGGDPGKKGDDVPYRPATPVSDDGERPSLTCDSPALRLKTEERIVLLGKEMREVQWKMANDAARNEERLSLLEARMATMDVREPGEESWEKVRPPTPPPPFEANIPSTIHSSPPKSKDRVEILSQALLELKSRMREWEDVTEELTMTRRRVAGTEIGLEGIRIEVGRRLGALESKSNEERLRKDLHKRDSRGMGALNSGLIQRVSRLESQYLVNEYRLITCVSLGARAQIPSGHMVNTL
jgi:hypothetical protein